MTVMSITLSPKADVRVGESFTSQKSKHQGIVEEIVPNANGSFRIRFADGRWTTAR